MNTTEIRDEFLSRARDIIDNEGWSVDTEAGDPDDVMHEIHNLMPDPEAYDDPAEYVEAIKGDLSLGWSFRDTMTDLGRDLIYTSDGHDIYSANTDACEEALIEIYGDLACAADGCDTISDLIVKAAACYIDHQWQVFVSDVEWQLESEIEDIEANIEDEDAA